MPEFVNPFSGLAPDRKLTDRELTRAIRLSLAAEEEAIHLYEAIADATDNPLAKKVLQDVANEEREHAGEFQQVLNLLLPDETQWMNNGVEEVNEMAAGGEAAEEPDAETPGGEASAPSVGDLRGSAMNPDD
jgi:rubrerythrin